MLLFNHEYNPQNWEGQEIVPHISPVGVVESITKARRIAGKGKHVEQSRADSNATLAAVGKQSLNNRQDNRSVLAPTGNSFFRSGCWDYSEFD